MRRRVWIAGGIAAAVVVAGIGFAVVREQRIAAGECAIVEALDAQTAQPIGSGEPITVVGDSYSHGFGLDDARTSWVSELDREATVHASSSAGFTKPGLCGSPSLTELLAGVDGPVVVQGGLNDIAAVDTVQDAAEAALADISGSVVVVGPALAPAFDSDEITAVDAALARAAADLDVTYVSTLGWDLDFAADGIHLSPEGHVDFGRQVRDALD